MFERAMGTKLPRRSAPAAFSTLPAPFASDISDRPPTQPVDAATPQQSGAAFDIGSIAIYPPAQQVGPEGGNLPPALADHIGARRGGGASLEPSMRQTMEAGFGQPFGDVHVHADGEADALNRSVSARAFTLGSDIFLGREAISTRPQGDDALMAHELTHVVQQRGTERGGPLTVDPADAPGEREASAMADAVQTGNAASTQMQPASQSHGVLQRAAAAPDAPAASDKPADIAAQGAFNPMDINHKLLRAIDQEQIRMVAQDDRMMYKRHVEFNDTVAALSNLTAKQIDEVNKAYSAHEDRRTLENDLFHGGESGYPTDLTPDQSAHLHALLGGTVADGKAPEEEKQAAATNAATAKAAELHRLLHGDLEDADIERIMTLLRPDTKADAALSAAANAALSAAYAPMGGDLRGEVFRMGPIHGQRAWKLMDGDTVGADAYRVTMDRARLTGINARVMKLIEDMKEDPYSAISANAEIKDLSKERKQLVEDIEQRGEQAGADAIATAPPGMDPQAAVKARVGAVLGDTEALATQVGGADAAMIRGMASDDPVQKTAAQLHKAAQEDKLNAEMLTASLRGLRAEAQQRAERSLPPGDPKVAETASHLADEYFTKMSTTYNSLISGDEKKWNELIDDTGDEGDQSVNIALMQQHGKLSDIAELILALKDDRKDTAAVQNVLRNKSAKEIKDLGDAYEQRTGKSLKYELFGNAATQGGEDATIYDMYAGVERKAETGEVLVKGKASGTDRLNLEDFMQRPDTEGGPQEVSYISERAEREYQYTLDHGGITGGIRDTFGNEERDLLDESIKEVRHLFAEYSLLIGWVPLFDPTAARVARPEMARSGEAHGLLEKMRLARATIRGDRAAYEKATAELRGMLQMVAAFVLQAALTALLTPAAGALLEALELGVDVAEGVEAASMGARIANFAASTTVNIASTVGANMAVYGDDYSVAMLKADLLGGLGGSIGGEAIDKMLGPVAKGLTERLGAKASQELIALAKTAGSMEGGAWAQGQSGDLTIQNLIKTHLMGKAAGEITKATGAATGLAPKPGAHAVTTPEEHTTPQTTESTPQESHPGATGSDEPRGTPVAAGQGRAPAGGGVGPRAGSREPTPPERLPSGAHDEEPSQTSSHAPTETTTTDEGRPGVRSPGGEEEPTLVDWEPDVVHELPSGSAIMFDTPAEGRKLYSQSIREDSQREVAIYRNTRTGEVVVGQGSAGEVALDLQVMHESLPGPPGTWELEAHYHPINEQTGVTPPAQRLPSSTNGDFSVLEQESQRAGNTPRTSRIDIITEGDRRNYTEFSYDPSAERPYKIDYPHPETGERTKLEFKSREAYEEWYSDNHPGYRADIEARSATTTTDGAAPAASSPGADEGGSGRPPDEGPRRATTEESTERPERSGSNDEQTLDDFASFDEEPTGVDLAPIGADPTAEEIRQLVQGVGLAPLPSSPEEMAHSNAKIDLAIKILQDPKASWENVRAAVRTLIDRAVAEYRAAHLEGGMTTPPDPRALTAEELRGCCPFGRDVSAEAILALIGNSPHEVMIERVQAENLGFGQVHGFSIVTLADGTRFLVDPTFAQFADEGNSFFSAGEMLNNTEGSALARDLLRDGVVPLTPEAARQYVIGLGADPAVVDIEDAVARLLTGDAAIVTEIVRNGKVDRITGYPDQVDNLETVSANDAAVLSSLQEMVPGMTADNPRRPLVESLMKSLERLKEYLRPLPEPPVHTP